MPAPIVEPPLRMRSQKWDRKRTRARVTHSDRSQVPLSSFVRSSIHPDPLIVATAIPGDVSLAPLPAGTSTAGTPAANSNTVTTAADGENHSTDPPLAQPGYMNLYNFYAPSLPALEKPYSITPTQTITLPTNSFHPQIKIKNNDVAQKFTIVAPRWSIDPADFHSCYPPQGEADQANILPHIVFSDPHAPWERSSISLEDGTPHSQPASNPPRSETQRVPWMALVVFDPSAEELVLSSSQLNPHSADSPFRFGGNPPQFLTDDNPATPGVIDPTITGSFKMTVADYCKLNPNVCLLPQNQETRTQLIAGKEGKKSTQVVFLNAALFLSLFTNDHKGRGELGPATKVDLEKYKYLAHVRNVNLHGMAKSAVLDPDSDTGLFSVVISHRSGPLDVVDKPRTLVVHLLSLEGLQGMKYEQNELPVGPTNGDKLVAMVSLYSWTYRCLPPESINFVDAMRELGLDSKQFLRVPGKVLNIVKAKADGFLEEKNLAGQKRMMLLHDRMNHGYSIVRHRVETGEETVAFTRGPFTPVIVPSPLSTIAWPSGSNTSQDYMILDQDLGIMDITYAVAWQLGKALAVADGAFVASLVRVRNSVHTKAVQDSKKASRGINFMGMAEAVNGLRSSLNIARRLADHGSISASSSSVLAPSERWKDTTPHFVPSTARAEVTKATKETNVEFALNIHLAMASTTSSLTPGRMFNEQNQAVNTDWSNIFTWLLDKMYLSGVPAHYLITDPSHLPDESIRFFYIDPNWIDALVDGALSVANHLSRDDDYVRQEIKRAMNKYLTTPRWADNPNSFPQVPTYGFLLRSAIVSAFPDIKIEAPFPDRLADRDRLDVIFIKAISKDVLLVLLDRTPESGELKSIKISQPPHQQCFALGTELTMKEIKFKFRKVYNHPEKVVGQNWGDLLAGLGNNGQPLSPLIAWPGPEGPTESGTADPRFAELLRTPVYDWDTRCLLFPQFTDALLRLLNQYSKRDEYQDTEITSSVMGVLLNNPVYFLEMLAPQATSPAPNIPQLRLPRTIWLGKSFMGMVDNMKALEMTRREPIEPPEQAVAKHGIPPQTGSGLALQEMTIGSSRVTSSQPHVSAPSVSAPPAITIPQLPLQPRTSHPAASVSVERDSETRSTQTAVPHASRSIPRISIAAAPAAASDPPHLSTVEPQFVASIYSSEHPPPWSTDASKTGKNRLPHDTPYLMDIIISLRLVGRPTNIADKLQIEEVVVTIPLSTTQSRGLVGEYYGTGARMLSNQRFFVKVERNPTQLRCRILPKSERKKVPLLRTRELSFRLNGVEVNPDATDGPKANCRIKENYIHDDGRVVQGNNLVQVEKAKDASIVILTGRPQ